VRGILERPTAQHNANPRGLSHNIDLFIASPFAHFVDFDFTAGGMTGISGKPPFASGQE